MKKIQIIKFFVVYLVILNIFSNVKGAVINKSFMDVNVPAAVVMDAETGRVLFEKNADEKRPMASLTKIMTSILLVENCNMDELIEVPAEATWIGGSEVGLKKGDKVTARSLLYGMLLPSGNDCAYTVGLHLGGTIENFAVMMNKKAKEIGCVNTNFANPHGLDNENHYTTAKELALITRYAIKNKNISNVMGTRSETVNFGSFSELLTNTNALLKTYDKADGGKTGFTNGANRCLMATASANGSRYIAVVLGAENTQIRFNTTKDILEACFNRYKKMDISNNLNFYINIPVIKGNITNYKRTYKDSLALPLTKEEYNSIIIKQEVIDSITPPMQMGTVIGKVEAYIEDEKIYEKEYILEENIYKKGFLDYLKEGITNMFVAIPKI